MCRPLTSAVGPLSLRHCCQITRQQVVVYAKLNHVDSVIHLVQMMTASYISNWSDFIHQQFAGLYNISNIHCRPSDIQFIW